MIFSYHGDKMALKDSMDRMLDAGVPLPHMECGRETYELISNIVIANAPIEEAAFTRRQIELGKVDLTFFGVKVVRCADVPEKSLWPPRAVSFAAAQRRMAKDMEVAR